MQRLFFLFIISLSFFHNSFAASFDCNKAARLQDKLVCTNPALSGADTQLAVLYKSALAAISNPVTLRKAQEAWLATRNTCSDTACLLQAYQTRIAMLQKISVITPANSVSISSPATTSAINMVSNATAVTPRNADGTYPVWVSPDLGVKSLSVEDINAALERKFWDHSAYQRDFKKEVEYLKAHQDDKALYKAQMDYYKDVGNPNVKHSSELGTAPTKDNAIPATCNQLLAREYGGGLWTFDLSISDASHLTYTLFLARAHSDCQAINLLRYAKPAKEGFVHNFVFTKNFVDFLPALITPDDLSCSVPTKDPESGEVEDRQALPENQNKSWSEFYGFNRYVGNVPEFKLRSLTPINVKMSPAYPVPADTELRLLAKGDFNASGIEQMLMGVDVDRKDVTGDTGRQGSALFLLSRESPTSILTLLYPEKYIEGSCDIQLDNFLKKLSSHAK